MADEKPKVSKAQQKAVKKYVKAHYDRIEFTAPKGYRERIQDHAAAAGGESLSTYIKKAVDARMNAEDSPDLDQ